MSGRGGSFPVSLIPPPVASPVFRASSFQVFSVNDEPETFVISVPPQAVTQLSLHG